MQTKQPTVRKSNAVVNFFLDDMDARSDNLIKP
jgi:hypothetical protein